MKSFRTLVAASLAALSSGAYATVYTWKAVEEDPDNVISNTAHFFNGSTPLDPATIASTDEVFFQDSTRLSLPPNAEYVSPFGVRIGGTSSGTLTVDLSDSIWRQPDRSDSETVYPATKFYLRNRPDWGDFFTHYSSNTRIAAFCLSNAVFRISQGVDNVASVDFDEGLFNFLNPNGVENGGELRSATWGKAVCHRLSFHDGTSLRVNRIRLYEGVSTNIFLFDGGSHNVKEFVWQKRSSDESQPDRTRIVVKGDARLVATSMAAGNESTNYHSGSVDVSESGVLRFEGEGSIVEAADTPVAFRIHDGGKLSLGWRWDFKWNNPSLVVTNATMETTESRITLSFCGGSVRLEDGADFSAAATILTGTGSLFEIKGGAARFNSLKIGAASKYYKSSTSATLDISGGTATVASAALSVAEAASDTGTLRLRGGILRAQGIAGGAGTSSLVADGGRIEALAASAGFISGLSTAAVGEGGLVVESDYDITIPQSFTNLGDVAGTLTLTGSGVKTLSGTATTVSNIVVAGGTVVFADGARAASKLVVLNGARVEFAGDPSAIGFTGLEVGDVATFGVLKLAPGQTLAVDGDVDIRSVRILLDGEFALHSSSTLLSATGAVSAGSAAAWEAALIGAGAVSGRSYGLSCETEGGVSSFKMSVSDPILLEQASGTRTISENVVFGPNEIVMAAVSNEATLSVSGEMRGGSLH